MTLYALATATNAQLLSGNPATVIGGTGLCSYHWDDFSEQIYAETRQDLEADEHPAARSLSWTRWLPSPMEYADELTDRRPAHLRRGAPQWDTTNIDAIPCVICWRIAVANASGVPDRDVA